MGPKSKYQVWAVILSGNNLMNLIVTRTFPPTIGGMQNLMWGLANAVSKIDLVKVYADYELNHESFDRALYSEGALAAAKWLSNKKSGLYSMRDLLKFK